jgi:HAD superfamily hydrolase (TIGR01490 family)
MGNKHVIFFDVDNTLSGTNSGYALVRAASDGGLLGPGDIILMVYILFLHKFGLRRAEDLINILGKKLKGMAVGDFSSLGKKAFEKYIRDSIFPGAARVVAELREKGAVIVVLSSAVDTVCIPLAEYLHFDDIICTGMESREDKLTGVPEGKYCYGSEKALRMKEYCLRNGFLPEDAWYYADSFSDLEALNISGNPVCVNPDRKLRKHAAGKGWRIETWKMKK